MLRTLPRARGDRKGGVESADSRLSRRGRKLLHSDRLMECRKDRVRDSVVTGTPDDEVEVEGDDGEGGKLG
jgi:hypothetical protein